MVSEWLPAHWLFYKERARFSHEKERTDRTRQADKIKVLEENLIQLEILPLVMAPVRLLDLNVGPARA